jgi:hypothetical protein
MTRISRHTAVAFIIALLASVGGLGIAVVAFGQDTDPTSPYAQTTVTPTPRTVPVAPPSTVTAPAGEQGSPAVDETGAAKPSRTHGSVAQPSRAVRQGPTTLAFTGADPLVLGGAGLLLMLAGLGLHRRRRRVAVATPPG